MSERLELLRPVLSRYQRRFTVLDLGAGINSPTLGYEIAQEFDAVVVEVEKDWKPVPVNPHTIVLKHAFTVPDLVKLSECEHFDVVLAFNFIHWFGIQWREAADAVLGMGDYVFVQLPTDSDMESVLFREAWPDSWQDVSGMNGYFKEQQAEWLGSTSQFPRHPPRPIYLRGNGVKRVTRTNWDAPLADAEVVVYSTHKLIQGSFHHKTPREQREWIPGINLWNFCRLGGVCPSHGQVSEMLHNLTPPPQKHGDIQPWNMILDGARLHLIDGGDAWGGDDSEGLAGAIRKVEECFTQSMLAQGSDPSIPHPQ